MDDPHFRELNEQEGRQLFDNACHRYLGISGEEFLRRWDSGYYEDPEEVMQIVMLIPFAR